MWRLYGWFSALMACGSCVGAVAWSARAIANGYNYKGFHSPDRAEFVSLVGLSRTWSAVNKVTHAIELMCMCTAFLMVLDRMSVFAAPRKWWAAAGRIVMAVVVLGNAVGLAANVAAAVHWQKSADAYSTASLYYASNITDGGDEFKVQGQEEFRIAGSIASVQMFCEVAALLLIVITFVVVGVLCARRVSARLLGVHADSASAATGRALRLQMLGTTGFIFVTFLLRTVFSIMYAIAYQLRNYDKKCPGLPELTKFCDSSCYNVYTHIGRWIDYTPEFQLTVMLVSSPLALLVALWGMTPKATLYLMKSSKRETALPLNPMKSVILK